MIAQNKDLDYSFELVMCERDRLGNKTNKKKNFVTDSAYKLWEFYEKNDIGPRKKKNSNVKESDNNNNEVRK